MTGDTQFKLKSKIVGLALVSILLGVTIFPALSSFGPVSIGSGPDAQPTSDRDHEQAETPSDTSEVKEDRRSPDARVELSREIGYQVPYREKGSGYSIINWDPEFKAIRKLLGSSNRKGANCYYGRNELLFKLDLIRKYKPELFEKFEYGPVEIGGQHVGVVIHYDTLNHKAGKVIHYTNYISDWTGWYMTNTWDEFGGGNGYIDENSYDDWYFGNYPDPENQEKKVYSYIDKYKQKAIVEAMTGVLNIKDETDHGNNNDHPDDNHDVSTNVARERNLFNAYLRYAVSKNISQITGFLGNLSDVPETEIEELKIIWDTDKWYYEKKYFEFELDHLLAQEPSDARDAIIEQALERLEDVEAFRSAPDVAILRTGFFSSLAAMLSEFDEPSTFVDVDFDPAMASYHPVLMIPSFGLLGLDGSDAFQERLEKYCDNGGTVIALSQQRGVEYSALRGGVEGYGTTEDQSCRHASTGLTVYHPALAGQTSVTPNMNVDGFFTALPEDAETLLTRTKNGQPEMIMYEHGNGSVIATTIYEDWAYSYYASSQEGRHLIRDLVTWARDPDDDVPSFAPNTGDVEVGIEVTNNGDTKAEKVVFTIVDPNRNIVGTRQADISLSAGSTDTVQLTYPTPGTVGIWLVDIALKDGEGNIVDQVFDAGRFAVCHYERNPGGFIYRGSTVGFDATTDQESILIGSDVVFKVNLYNHGTEDVDLTLNMGMNHHASVTEVVTVPAETQNSTEFIWSNAGSGRFWCWVYDDKGDYLGVTEKGVWGLRPSAGIDVSTDKMSYSLGHGIDANVTLHSEFDLDYVTLDLEVLDPSGEVIHKNSTTLDLEAWDERSHRFVLVPPNSSLSGYYHVVVNAYKYGHLGGASSRFVYAGGNGSLKGTVRDLVTNDPVPNASIYLDGFSNYSTTSDQDGNYSIDLSGSVYTAEIAAEGYHDARTGLKVVPFSNNTIDIYTTSIGARGMVVGDQGVEGTVVTVLGDDAIPGAEVVMNLSTNQVIITSDADGRFSQVLPAGIYNVTAEYQGMESPFTTVTVHSGRWTERDLILDGSVMTGTVLDIVTGLPIKSAVVVFDHDLATMTDEDGAFAVPLAIGIHDVWIGGSIGYEAITTSVHASYRGSHRTFYLMPASNITRGRVLDLLHDTPLVDADISVDGIHNTTTDSDGYFVLELTTGVHSIKIDADDHEGIETSIHISTSSSEHTYYLKPTINWTTGVVMDQVTGSVLPGVNISFDGTENTTTDAEGRFEVLLSTGFHSITVDLEDYRSMESTVHVAERSSDHTFFLDPVTRTITGRVLDLIHEGPIEDASISFDGIDNTTTDEDGTWSITLSTGLHNVIVTHSQYSDLHTTIHVAQRDNGHDLYLLPPATNISYFNGTVLDQVYDIPLENVNLTFDGTTTVWTDSNGNFSAILPTDYYSLSISLANYSSISTTVHVAGRTSDQVFFLLPTTRSFTGRVLNVTDDSPVADALLVFNGVTSVTTNGSGAYAATLSTGLHEVLVNASGYENLTTTVHVSPRSSGVDLLLVPVGHVPNSTNGVMNGTVRDVITGEPVQGLTIWYDGWDRTATDSNGTFSFSHTEGNHRFRVIESSRYYEVDTSDYSGMIIHGDRNTTNDLYVTPKKGILNGTVYDEVSGDPISGITVWYDGWDRVITDENGTYAFEYLHGPYRYRLKETSNHYEIDTSGYQGINTFEGRINTVDFYMTPRKGVINGTVYDVMSGDPIQGVTVWYDGWDRTTTDANGTYSFYYRDGSHRFRLKETSNHYEIDTSGYYGITVYNGRHSSVDLYMMPKEGVINGTVRDSVTGMPLQGITVWYDGWDRTSTDANGSYSFQYYEGNHRFRLKETSDHYEIDTSGYSGIQVDAGRTTTLDLFMTPMKGVVNGTVRDAITGEPLTGITVWHDGWDRTITDANGSYAFEYYHGNRRFRLKESNDHYEIDTSGSPGISIPQGRVRTIDLYMYPKKGIINGTVYDAVSGDPVSGITVWHDGWDRTTTDANGSYAFQYHHGNRRFRLKESHSYYEIDTSGGAGFMVHQGTSNRIDMYMTPKNVANTGTITGVVKDQVSGVGLNATLVISGTTIETDRNGSYSLEVTAGPVPIDVTCYGYSNRSMVAYVPWVRGLEYDIEMDLLAGNGTLTGTMIDKETEEPVSGAKITVYSGYPSPHTENATTDGNGSYTLLLPSRSYIMRIDAAGYNTMDGRTIVLKDDAVHRKDYLEPTGSAVLRPAELEIVSLPQDTDLFIGDTANLRFSFRNIGDLLGSAFIEVSVPGIFEGSDVCWVLPGEENDLTFTFEVPDDIGEGSYDLIYKVDGIEYEDKMDVIGLDIEVDAALDRTLYNINDTANLTIWITNLKEMDVSIFTRVKYGDHDAIQEANLTSLGAIVIYFDVPVEEFIGDKMFYGVYTSSGSALYINSLHVGQVPEGAVTIYTDMQVYRIGETMTVTVETDNADPIQIRALGQTVNLTKDDVVNGSAQTSIVVPSVISGTYWVTCLNGNRSGQYPIDIQGYDARVTKTSLSKDRYEIGDKIDLKIRVSVDRPLRSSMTVQVIDPYGTPIETTMVDEIDLMQGENDIEVLTDLPTTQGTGTHTINYEITTDDNGTVLVLAAGSRRFDAVDTMAPELLNVAGANITSGSGRIDLNCSEMTNVLLEFGKGTPSATSTSQRWTASFHGITIDGLEPSTIYSYNATIEDLSGNTNNTGERTMTTMPYTPSDLELTTGSAAAKPGFSWGQAPAPSKIRGYYVRIDNGTEEYILISEGLKWRSSKGLRPGNHTFSVQAYDIHGNVGEESIIEFTIEGRKARSEGGSGAIIIIIMVLVVVGALIYLMAPFNPRSPGSGTLERDEGPSGTGGGEDTVEETRSEDTDH